MSNWATFYHNSMDGLNALTWLVPAPKQLTDSLIPRSDLPLAFWPDSRGRPIGCHSLSPWLEAGFSKKEKLQILSSTVFYQTEIKLTLAMPNPF